jgi:hypothetical protein
MSSHSPAIPLFLGLEKKFMEGLGFLSAPIAVQRDARKFRNIFGPAKNAELYRGHPEGTTATAAMLSRLATRMKECYPWPDLDTKPCTRDENENIPAGYTYLAQLVAHDLVQNMAPLPHIDNPEGFLRRDFRLNRMVMETIYGGGPAASPGPFALPEEAHGERCFLRLGHVMPRAGDYRKEPLVGQAPRDIPRARCPHLSDSRPRKGTPDAFVADPRNDDHLILSQLTALFHEFHNIVCRHVLKATPAPTSGPRAFHFERAFLLSRKIVARIYRRIVVEDLMSRLLEPEIFARYKDESRKFLDVPEAGDDRVPLEFSHAAFRFGHVMIRFSYTLNKILEEGASIRSILDRSSARQAHLLPVACDWIIDWKHFFETEPNGAGVTFSRGIRPYIGSGPLTNDTYFDNSDPSGALPDGGIFYRDLVRGADASLRSVASVIDKLPASDRQRCRLLSDAGYREHVLGEWLKYEDPGRDAIDRGPRFLPADIVSLSQDPPLFFFILFEAAHTQRGKRLGILGSTIVAEVVFAALEKERGAIEKDAVVTEKVKEIFGPGRDPKNMPGLIKFIKANGGLQDVECPPAAERPPADA